MKSKQKSEKTPSLYPMRINKYLAHKGHATRRGADELILKNTVYINGELAVLGDKVLEADLVEIRTREKPKKYAYFAYNKPKGVITHSPQNGEKDIKEKIKHQAIPRDVFPIGRLDKDSHGLIILTNDGRITDRLLNPDYAHEKEYAVQTINKLRPSFGEHMEAGVDIGEYVTKKCKVEIKGEAEFNIILGEGKKHQIRRMCVALHNDVRDLKRIRIMNIKIGDLKTGSFRAITGEELSSFLKSLGL